MAHTETVRPNSFAQQFNPVYPGYQCKIPFDSHDYSLNLIAGGKSKRPIAADKRSDLRITG
jgi:hypothetical protein